jgi:hypothetical protein
MCLLININAYVIVFTCVNWLVDLESLRMLQRSTITKVATYAGNYVIQVFLFWDVQYNMWFVGNYIYPRTENNSDKI